MRTIRAAAILVLAGCMSGRAFAQENNCHPPMAQPDPAANMFTPEQEIQLGDVLAGQLRLSTHISDDPAVVAYLNRIGERLTAHLPATGLKFRYFVLDNPAPNAFSIAGGRIYIDRGLASFVRSEDELASVLAHEMGHIVAHQTAITMTALFREVLGVTSITGRDQIVVNLNRLQEALRRNPQTARRLGGKDSEEQGAADQIGFYAAVSAGYSSQAFADVFDRIAQTSGKTGNFFTDLFGVTTPDQRRLREMIRMAQSLPAACISQRSASAADEFQPWKAAVLQFSNWNRPSEQLHGVLAKAELEKIVMRDVSHLSFSPNGKYILAREADELYVFTREPLSFLFQIDAHGAVETIFSADSTKVAFSTALPHVEAWDIATRTRAQSFDVLERRCLTQALSPRLDALGCAGEDGTLSLLDLRSGALRLERKHFGSGWHRSILFVPGKLGFSPDGRYFVAAGMNDPIIYDLAAGQSLKVPSPLRDRMEHGFAFLGSDRIMAGSPSSTFEGLTVRVSFEAGIFNFPEGKLIGTVPIGRRGFATPTRGDYALLYPYDKYAIGVMNLNTKRVLLGIEQKSADVYDSEYVRPLADGDLGLFDIQTGKIKAHTALPKGSGAGFVRAFASPELNWVAGCGLERCAVWNASSGKRTFLVRPFNAAWFDGEKLLYADFLKFKNNPRVIGRLEFANPGSAGSEPVDTPFAEMMGRLLVTGKPARTDSNLANREQEIQRGEFDQLRGFWPCNKFQELDPLHCNVTWEFRDAAAGNLLWSRHFAKESPAISVEPEENLVVLRWGAAIPAVQEELKSYPAIAAELADKKEKKDFQLIEIVDAPTGHVARVALADAAAQIRIMGNRMIAAHARYMEIWALEGMKKEGETVGRPAACSRAAGLMTVLGENPNEIAVYNLETREKVDEFAFSSNIALSQFSADGKRLLILTNDQTAYTLTAPAGSAVSASIQR